ncbi:MAG: sulfite exporter TauE/SafE family protein, partial [Armatimonadota bacterium]
MWSAFLIGLLAGFAAFPHCVGMCGGFALYLSKPQNPRGSVMRLILFLCGKTFTYIFLGVLASSLGKVLFNDNALHSVSFALRISVGLLTVAFGLALLGISLPVTPLKGKYQDFIKLIEGFIKLPAGSGGISAFGLGLGVGFLPCPLLMGMLVALVGLHNLSYGAALMAGVGFGTAPGLLVVGLLGAGLSQKFKVIGTRAVGVVVLAIGLLIIGRTTGLVSGTPVDRVLPACCGG